MIKSAVTVALVPEITKGPWVYWEPLEQTVPKAAALGFDAVELFTGGSDALNPEEVNALCRDNNIKIAAAGTGAGKVIKGLTLTSADVGVRAGAISFITGMMDFAAMFDAPVIIGSMQGNVEDGVEREQALEWLGQGLEALGNHAGEKGVKLIYEPLNRYETNMFNRLGEAGKFIEGLGTENVVLLADLFHMNIEEVSIEQTLRDNASHIGHVHFADSNRRPIGNGHTPMDGVAAALKEIDYDGYVSAEAFPWPTPDEAAQQTIKAFKQYFG